jgi:pilus assembly protein CpaB
VALSTLTAPRAVRRPREIDWRLVLGAVTGLIGLVGTLVVVATLVPEERAVVVATRDLAAGSTLGAADLSVARVRLPEAMAAQSLPESELGTLVGRQVSESVHAQQLLTRPQLSPPHAALGPGQDQLYLPLKPDAAVPDDLAPGEQVRIIATIAQGKAGAGTRPVVERAPVVKVEPQAATGGTAASHSRAPGAITLTVSRQEALDVADARVNGELLIVRAGPES